MVKFTWVFTVTPSGSFTSLMWSAWAIFRWLTSTSIFSGMARGQRVHLEVAAALRQDAALGHAHRLADEDQRHVHLDLLVLAHVDEVGVEHLPAQRVLLVVLEQHQALGLPVELQGDAGC